MYEGLVKKNIKDNLQVIILAINYLLGNIYLTDNKKAHQTS